MVVATLGVAFCTLLSINIAVTPQAVDGSSSAGLTVQTIDLGDVVVISYQVIFHHIEVGNSDVDKFTLWENDAGVTQDLVNEVAFENMLSAMSGAYQFIRLTGSEDIDLGEEVSGVPR